jgi:hypothetical protein
MKQLLSVAVNYQKSLKSTPEDENDNVFFAEVNLILTEPSYKISETNELERVVSISECEICMSIEHIEHMIKSLKDVKSKLTALERKEKQR